MITKTNERNENERTIIIACINGDIGQEFAKRLEDLGKLYGISRKNKTIECIQYEHVRANLLKSEEVSEAFKCINLSKNIIYIHLPGKFQFQDENHPIADKNNDGIDDDIFATNVDTFRNTAPYLMQHLKVNTKTRLKLVAIGSTSDLYAIPYWHSFTQAKNELRKEFRKAYGNLENFGRVSSLFINVSTVDGKQLAGERPFISKEFCLSPKEIVAQSCPYLLDDRASSLEISVLKPNPSFFDENFLSNENTRKRWYNEMYGNLKA